MPIAIRSQSAFYLNFYHISKRYFHVTPFHRKDDEQDYYKTLDIPYNATPADIKRYLLPTHPYKHH
jgi:hypothetical protein